MQHEFLFPFYILVAPSYAFQPSSQTIYEGIDVSVYQGNIDFPLVRLPAHIRHGLAVRLRRNIRPDMP